MPQKIINDFKKQYGKKKGKAIYYATAQKQGRDPETFKKKNKKVDVKESMIPLTEADKLYFQLNEFFD